jgi:hypothetical protein
MDLSAALVVYVVSKLVFEKVAANEDFGLGAGPSIFKSLILQMLRALWPWMLLITIQFYDRMPRLQGDHPPFPTERWCAFCF